MYNVVQPVVYGVVQRRVHLGLPVPGALNCSILYGLTQSVGVPNSVRSGTALSVHHGLGLIALVYHGWAVGTNQNYSCSEV